MEIKYTTSNVRMNIQADVFFMGPLKENLELLACYGCRYKDDCEEPFEHGRPMCDERHADAVEFAKRLNENFREYRRKGLL